MSRMWDLKKLHYLITSQNMVQKNSQNPTCSFGKFQEWTFKKYFTSTMILTYLFSDPCIKTYLPPWNNLLELYRDPWIKTYLPPWNNLLELDRGPWIKTYQLPFNNIRTQLGPLKNLPTTLVNFIRPNWDPSLKTYLTLRNNL